VQPYRLSTAPGVDRALERLPEFAAAAIVEFTTGELIAGPLRAGKPLRDELEGYRVARRGVYRVLYRVLEQSHTVRVVRVEHRADVYRRR
jgi:mRNA interferase RelE/StbE